MYIIQKEIRRRLILTIQVLIIPLLQIIGLIGLLQGPRPNNDYWVSCPHYLHIGWIGAVVTPRYSEMLDFIVGWTTLDISFDDIAGVE